MCSKVFVLLVLILNKNRLLFSLFERYYLLCTVDNACLIFQDSSSMLLLIYVNVNHWYLPPLARLCCWDPSLSRKEANYQTVSSISHLYLGEVHSDAVDYHNRD